MKFTRSILAAALATLMSGPGLAADELTDAMQAAYAPYREALFRTNSKAQAESEAAVAAARSSWKSLSERFGSRAPAPYDRDTRLVGTLTAVAAVYERAEAQIRDRKLPEAHETLEEARDLMAELRRRNGVVVYSDHMNAYHEQMEHAITDGLKEADGPQGALMVMARVGALEWLVGRLRAEAPAALQREAAFLPALQAVEASVTALRSAALAQDVAAMRRALTALKRPYSQLFLKFG